MRRFRPLHALALVALVLASVLGAERLLTGGRGRFERVGPDRAGEVRVDLAGFRPGEVRFYRFLNSGNQEVRFFAGLDPAGAPLAAFDASENDYKMNRGFEANDGWIVNNKCSTSFRLAEVNAGPSGCAPVPLAFRLDGRTMVLAEGAVLEGWRYFR